MAATRFFHAPERALRRYGETVADLVVITVVVLIAYWAWFDPVSNALANALRTPLEQVGGPPTLVALATSVVAVWEYGHRGVRRGLVWAQSSYVIVDEEDSAPLLPKLRLMHEGRRVPRATLTKLVFWNSGNQMLEPRDLETMEPLAIGVSDAAVILDTRILADTSGGGVQLAHSLKSTRSLGVSFEYLNPGKGAVLQFIHTDTQDNGLRVAGRIRGIDKLSARTIAPARWLSLPTPSSFDTRIGPVWRRRLNAVVQLITGVGLAGYNLPQLILDLTGDLRSWQLWVFIVFRACLAALGMVYVWRSWRLARQRLPAGLEAYDGP